MTEALDPAFCMPPWADIHGTVHHGFYGLSKREYFAAKAMEGFCGRQYDQGEPSSEHIAGWSVAQADALIAALNAKQQP